MIPVRYVWVCVLGLLAAGSCGFVAREREERVESGPSEEVFLREGQSSGVLEDQVSVTLVDVEQGNRISEVTIRLATSDGASNVETVEAVRNQRFSEALRLESYAVRVVEYPGVDSARLIVTREVLGVAPD